MTMNLFATFFAGMGNVFPSQGYKGLAVCFSALTEGIIDVTSKFVEWVSDNPKVLITPIM